MQIARIALGLIALVCLGGWLWLRKPYSPTDELPAVAYTAFEVEVPDSTAGIWLAKAARGWQGVTASTYNPSSGLLVLSHLESISVQELQSQLQILSSRRVSKKVFPEPSGAKCPVPQAALAALPSWLLGLGLLFGLGFLLPFFISKTSPKTHLSH